MKESSLERQLIFLFLQLRQNVFQLALPQFQNLHKWLEVDYNPLNLCSNVQSVIDQIRADEENPLMQYIEALQDVTLVRLVRQVSQVYQTIEFARFLELAKFANTFKLERILVDCVRHNDMQITIDHKEKMVMFGTDLSESQREDHHDGPVLQSMPSEQVRQQLVNMSVVLHRAIAAINPNRQKGEREALRAKMVALYHENKVREHQNILIRQKLIEDRKETIERMNSKREEEEQRRQEELLRQQKIAEQKRLEQEAEEREKKRSENERQQIQKRTMIEKLQQISQTTHGAKLLKIIEEKGSAPDPDEIEKEERNALQRERKELQSRLKSQEKKVDYFERAKRLEEVPLIKEYLKEMVVKEEVFWQTQEKTRIENAVAERKNAVAQQERLKRMYADRDAYMNQLKADRKNMYLDKLKNFNDALEEERKKRLAQRVHERRTERRNKWLAEREAERQRKLDEIRREEEEIKKLEQERRAKERAAELEVLRKQTETQRARDEEIEKKMQVNKEKRFSEKPRDSEAPSAWRSVGAQKERDFGRERDTGRDAGREVAREPAKEGIWRAPAREADSSAAGGGGNKWRSDKSDDQGGFRRGDKADDNSGFRRADKADDNGGFRRGDKSDDQGGFRRGEKSDDQGGFRRNDGFNKAGRDDNRGFRRGGADSDAPIRRSGDEPRGDRTDGGFRKMGGDRRDNRDFKRGDDNGGFKRGDDKGGFKRGDDNNSTNWRTSNAPAAPKDESSSWRRADAPRGDDKK